MVDIHTHILPGIDDGARDIYDTLEMAQIAADNGITDIVATPHCNIPGLYSNYYSEAYKSVFLKAKRAIRDEGIPVRLYPGMEVYITEDVPALMAAGKIMPINSSRYVLMEFAFDSDPEFANYMLAKIYKMRVIPLIAHIERYYFLQDDPDLALEWRRRGYVLQCNKGSFQGHFGRREQHTAYDLLDQGLVDVIATDCHRPYRRTPNVEEIYESLLMDYPESYMKHVFEENPRRLIHNQPFVVYGSRRER